MARNRLTDYREAFLVFLFAVGICALIYLSSRFLDKAIWKNIYLGPVSGSSSSLLTFFFIVANQLNNAAGRPKRIWASIIVGLIGLAIVAFGASQMADMVPQFDLCSSVCAWIGGGTAMAMLRDGVPAQTWRNLFAKGLDYGGRFFPLAGFLLCVVLLVLWGMDQWTACSGRDYNGAIDIACFICGAVLALFAGKRRSDPPSTLAAGV